MIPQKVWQPLEYCTVSCLCNHCLLQDGRLSTLTRNNWYAEVRFYR